MKDVVAELKAESERKKTVGGWLSRRKKKLKAGDKDQHKKDKKEG